MPDASFVVTKVEGDGESATNTRKQMVETLKGIPAGRAVLGAIGRDLDSKEIESVAEELTSAERDYKQRLMNILFKYVDPPDMGVKFKPEQAKRILWKKLEKQTLGELRRFWKGKIPSNQEIDPDKVEEVRRKWNDISP